MNANIKWGNAMIPMAIINVIIIFVCLMFSGCTKVTYGDMTYLRLGGQEFNKFKGTILDDGSVEVEFGSQKSEDIAEIAGKIAEGVVKGMGL